MPLHPPIEGHPRQVLKVLPFSVVHLTGQQLGGDGLANFVSKIWRTTSVVGIVKRRAATSRWSCRSTGTTSRAGLSPQAVLLLRGGRERCAG